MKEKDIKTIDILTKTWFDKVNGNTYFAQRITINYGMDNGTDFVNHFQYGYSSFEHYALEFIKKELGIKTDVHDPKLFGHRGKIIVRSHTIRDCKKRELMNI